MSDEIKQKEIKSPFMSSYILKVCSKIDSGVLSDTEIAILRAYLLVWDDIAKSIKKISNGDLVECHRIMDMGYPKTDPYKNNPPSIGHKDYIKYQLGNAMVICESGLSWAMDGYSWQGVRNLCLTHSIFTTTKMNDNDADSVDDLRSMISKYRQGPKSKSEKSQKNWDLAKQYFEEELPKHTRRSDARLAAAKRAGITVAMRRLIEMLPVEK
jgi:hypothetical protein